MTTTRSNLGPLTTAFTYPASCTNVNKVCVTCDNGYQAQTCSDNSFNAQGIQDNVDCWPPRSEPATISSGIAVLGYGFYSPGFSCPVGLSTACVATNGVDGGFQFQFPLTEGETGVGCCPSGYMCQFQPGVGNAQTCYRVFSTGSFPTVQCSSGTSISSALVTMPVTTTATVSQAAVTTVLSRVTVMAPLIQLIRKSSTETTTTANATSSGAGFTDNSPDDQDSGGLSAGAKAGVGVGVGVAALLLIGALVWFFRSRRQKRAGALDADAAAASPPGYDGKGAYMYGPPSAELGPSTPRAEAPAGPYAGGDVAELGTGYVAELPEGTHGHRGA